MSNNLSAKALLDYEAGIARVILATVIELTPQLGRPPSRSMIAATLVGSVRRDLVAADVHRVTTFGVFNRHGLDSCYEWIDTLIQRGLLEVIQGRRGVVCTANGRVLIEGLTKFEGAPLGLFPGAVDTARLDLGVRSGLLEALRRYRMERAGEAEVPEYRLISDATLREIAAKWPQSLYELEVVAGLGEKRIASYGAELLRIVAEHMPIIDRLQDRSGAVPS